MTQVTPGVPVRVVAVSAFDPAAIALEKLRPAGYRPTWRWTAWVLSAVALAAASASLVLYEAPAQPEAYRRAARPAICRATGRSLRSPDF